MDEYLTFDNLGSVNNHGFVYPREVRIKQICHCFSTDYKHS